MLRFIVQNMEAHHRIYHIINTIDNECFHLCFTMIYMLEEM